MRTPCQEESNNCAKFDGMLTTTLVPQKSVAGWICRNFRISWQRPGSPGSLNHCRCGAGPLWVFFSIISSPVPSEHSQRNHDHILGSTGQAGDNPVWSTNSCGVLMEFGQCFEPQDPTRVNYSLLLERRQSVMGWSPSP